VHYDSKPNPLTKDTTLRCFVLALNH
jgi:hypothetical protein